MGIELLFGDSIRRLRDLPSDHYDAIVTDPPYLSSSGVSSVSTSGNKSAEASEYQYYRFWFSAVMDQVRRCLKPGACGFIFCDARSNQFVTEAVHGDTNARTRKPFKVSQYLVWDREGCGLGLPFRATFEMIAFLRGQEWSLPEGFPRDIRNVIRHRYPYGPHPHHGAEKPVELVRQLVEWATWGTPEARILDPFAGSGTTLIAASMLGRSATGIEVSPDTFRVARDRIAAAGIACAADELPIKPADLEGYTPDAQPRPRRRRRVPEGQSAMFHSEPE